MMLKTIGLKICQVGDSILGPSECESDAFTITLRELPDKGMLCLAHNSHLRKDNGYRSFSTDNDSKTGQHSNLV